jgi:hypothetical protein
MTKAEKKPIISLLNPRAQKPEKYYDLDSDNSDDEVIDMKPSGKKRGPKPKSFQLQISNKDELKPLPHITLHVHLHK